MDEHRQEAADNRPRRRLLRTTIAATASLLVISAGSVAVHRHGNNDRPVRNNIPSIRRKGRELKEASWYPATVEGTKTCTFNADYPDGYLNQAPENTVYLFDSELQCCTAFDVCVKPEKWYPIELDDGLSDGGVADLCFFDNNYPDEYMETSTAAVVLFDSEEDCCTTYHCQTSSLVFEERWYAKEVDGAPACVFGNDYNPEFATNPTYTAAFLFDTRAECCNGFPVACPGMIWHLNQDGTGCVFKEIEADAEHVFISEVDCLAHMESGGKEAGEDVTATTIAATTTATVAATTEATASPDASTTADPTTSAATSTAVTTSQASTTAEPTTSAATSTAVTTSQATTTEVTTAATTLDPCTDCAWHEDIEEPNTCSNSLDYPAAFEQAREYFFFRTAQDCCDRYFSDVDCTIIDVDSIATTTATASAVNAGAYYSLWGDVTDDFESDIRSLRFDVGSPPQWKRTPFESLSGSISMTNIPVEGLGASSDLTLKINVLRGSTVSCMAKIGTSMPYEYFVLTVNGQQRNVYSQRIDGWIPVLTGINPGENTLVFSVVNNREEHNMGDIRLDHYGEGKVYLDDCEVRAN